MRKRLVALLTVLALAALPAAGAKDPAEEELQDLFDNLLAPATWHGNAPIPPGSTVADFEDPPLAEGYRIFADTGEVYAFGGLSWDGNVPAGSMAPGERVIEGTSGVLGAGEGYTIVTSRGQVFNFGGADCPTFDAANLVPGDEIVDAVVTVDPVIAEGPESGFPELGCALYLLSRMGNVYALGGAPWCGSVDQIAGDALLLALDFLYFLSGECRYTVVTTSGAVYAFGGSEWFGALDAGLLGDQQVVAFTPTAGRSDFNGYVLWTDRGNSYAFGKAEWPGNLAPLGDGESVIDVAAQFQGYVAVTNLGRVDGVDGGDDDGEITADMLGDQRVVAVSPTPFGGYHLVTGVGNVYAFDQGEFFEDVSGGPLFVMAAAQAAGTAVPPPPR